MSALAATAISIDLGPGLVAVALAAIAVVKTFLTGRQVKAQAVEQVKELKPNGGSSLRDAIDRIEQHTAATAAAVAEKLPPPPPPSS